MFSQDNLCSCCRVLPPQFRGSSSVKRIGLGSFRFLDFFNFNNIDFIQLFLQDFLGIMFSINMLKVLRLPSLRICTILLSALFFYDIFFVFITPLFMSGKSVMVEVATGHSSDEQLPMVKQS